MRRPVPEDHPCPRQLKGDGVVDTECELAACSTVDSAEMQKIARALREVFSSVCAGRKSERSASR